MTDYERAIERNVAEHGWHCTTVIDPDGVSPDFAYSVGFRETLGMPELIVFGLSSELMHAMLWNAFRDLQAGKEIKDGDRWSGLLARFDCVARAVHPTNLTREYFNSALWYHGDPSIHGPLLAFQIVWPGAEDGLFPWDTGSDPFVCEIQPPLYLPGAAIQ